MKKLMMVMAVALTAVVANAASVYWQSGVVFRPSDSAGTLVANGAYKIADTSTASMYLFVLTDAAAYSKVSTDGVWNTYEKKLDTATAKTSTLENSKFETLTTDGYDAGSTVYAAVLFTYTDDDGKEWYLENMTSVEIDDLGGNGAIASLARYIGGVASNEQLAAWTAVPEPTSGLLVLLGMAGLALKRKRA